MTSMANSYKVRDLSLSGSKFIGGNHVGVKTTCRGQGTLALSFPAGVSINNPK